MIIVRLSQGLANQMYQYAAAYSLARELNQEVVLDISECVNAGKSFSLDYFNIPDLKKIIYDLDNEENIGHMQLRGVPQEIRNKAAIFVEFLNDDNYPIYTGLEAADGMRGIDNIYLCGYWSNREKYFLKYWDDIRKQFSLRTEEREILMFRELIKGKVSIGVHIRRGDMLLCDWAVHLEDNYYKAAISCCKEKFPNCIFLIFSDDIDYAKKFLGEDSTIYYVHFLGYNEAALIEFISLSLCDHRIMSNSSTFSRLADELNWKEKRRTFWKDCTKDGIRQRKTGINYEKRNIFLTQYDIEYYSKKYSADAKKKIANYLERVNYILDTTVGEENFEFVLDEISKLSLDTFELLPELEQKLLYKKFEGLVYEKNYHNALEIAYKLYNDYCSELKFEEKLLEALIGIGAKEEAVVESVRMGDTGVNNRVLSEDKFKEMYKSLETVNKYHFVVVPEGKMCASTRIYGLVKLGLVLQHLGHKVSFVFRPYDQTEKYYIQKNRQLTNRQGVCLKCYQYLYDEIIEKGVANFYNQIDEDNNLVIISEREEFIVPKVDLNNRETKYVFPDFCKKITENVYKIFEAKWQLGFERRLSKEDIAVAGLLLKHLE